MRAPLSASSRTLLTARVGAARIRAGGDPDGGPCPHRDRPADRGRPARAERCARRCGRGRPTTTAAHSEAGAPVRSSHRTEGARAIAQSSASTVGIAIRLAASGAAKAITPAMMPRKSVWNVPHSGVENHPAELRDSAAGLGSSRDMVCVRPSRVRRYQSPLGPRGAQGRSGEQQDRTRQGPRRGKHRCADLNAGLSSRG